MNGILKTMILSVAAASLLAAIAMAFVRAGALREIVRFAAGLMLTIALLTPLSRLELFPWRAAVQQSTAAVEQRIDQAEQQGAIWQAQAAAREIEAYITGRLREQGVGCTVQATMQAEEDGLALAYVTLAGVDTGQQAQARAILEEECGIAKEKQNYVETADD